MNYHYSLIIMKESLFLIMKENYEKKEISMSLWHVHYQCRNIIIDK